MDRNVLHASVNRVANELHQCEAHSAKDSFSQMSSHQRMVTRSPNHMWAISCRMVLARCSYSKSVTWDRKMNDDSAWVTQPKFSIAPALKSGTHSWSYLGRGYRTWKCSWKKSKPCRVIRNRSSGSRYCLMDSRTNRPRSMPSWVVRTSWYGPAHRAVMYVLITAEVSK